MKVKLLSYTPNPEEVCAKAFRSCHSSDPSGELELEKPVEYYINKAKKLGHLSTLEHASFTFSIEGISRSCSHQIVRHRIASYSQQSMRYVELDKDDNIIPPSIKGTDKETEYKNMMRLSFNTYHRLIENGVPKEDARFVLPIASRTNLTLTMNARELLHFIDLRLDQSAQWEIRKVANKMLKSLKGVAPNLFSEVDK